MRAALLALLVLSGCRLETPPAPDSALEAEVPPIEEDSSVLEDAAPRVPLPDLEVDPERTRLLIPVVGVPPSELVDTFEDARSEGRDHDAIDILAPRGTPVVAAAPGRLVRLFTSDKGGLTAYVLGLDGRTVYYYAHLDAYARGLAEGALLEVGDPIGTVGDTGNAVPGNTHLHFAIWTTDDPAGFWDGASVNPYPLLAGE